MNKYKESMLDYRTPDHNRLSRLAAVEADTGIRPMVVSTTLECRLW